MPKAEDNPKFYDSGFTALPDPYAELRADCVTVEDVLQLEEDIERAEASE